MKNSEKIHLHLLEYDSPTDSNHIKDLGEVTFDEKGIAKVKFTIDEIKTELNKLNFERGNYEMFFAAEFKEGGVQFAEVSRKKRGGKDTVYPVKTVSHSELEKAKFTYIDSKKDITSVRFLKTNGKDAYEVIRYGETITLKVQTRNMNGTELNLKNIIKNNFGNGIEEHAQNVKKKVENEKVEWTLNTGVWKKWTKQPNMVSFYQVEIVEADGDKVKYPKENARLKDGSIDWTKLLTYQSLKLSDNTVISELAKTNAPLIIGEPLEPTSTSTGTCVCKDYDLIWGNKVSCEFRKKVVEISKELWGESRKMKMANELMACIALETGSKFTSDVGYPNATGLVQFTSGKYGAITAMNETGYNNGKTITKDFLKNLTPENQLDYVKLYFKMWMEKYKKTINDSLDMYMCIWCPAAVGKEDSYVCYSEERDKKNNVTHYSDNKSAEYEYYDENEKIISKRLKKDSGRANGEITKGELRPRLKYWTVMGEGNKVKSFNCVFNNSNSKDNSGKAPWMPYAWEENNNKVSAWSTGSNPRINEYFNASTNGKGWNDNTNWCGAFISWCFVQAGYTPPALSARAAMWQFWKQIDRPIYGAAAVIDWGANEEATASGSKIGGDGHITFVVGVSKDGNYYYCLGGNQGGSKGARNVQVSRYSKSDIDWFVIPPNYNPSADEYQLEVMSSTTDIDNVNTTRN